MARLIQNLSGDGIVCAVGKGKVFVAPIPSQKDCGHAAGCGKCGGCLPADAGHGGYAGRFYIPVDDSDNYKPGDRVTFSRFTLEPNLASALVFGVPIIMVISVFAYIAIRVPRLMESTAPLFAATAAFSCGLVIVGVLDKIFKAKYPAAIIGQYNHDGKAVI